MINKPYIESIFEKYYLNGLIESVILNIKDNNILIRFIKNDTKNLTGFIEASNFKFQDCEIGIYDTTQFLKLISILNVLIELKSEERNGMIQKLKIADNVYNLEYPLANVNIIPKCPKIEEFLYEIEFDINKEFISNFLKASKALKVETLIIDTYYEESITKIKFCIGENTNFSNKIDFSIPGKIGIPGGPIIFPLNEFSCILNNNKDLEIGKGYINYEGLMKLEFESKDKIKSTYFLVGKE